MKNKLFISALSVILVLIYSHIIYPDALNVKISKTNTIGELIVKWNEVPDATVYFVKMFDVMDFPNYIVNILRKGGNLEENELEIVQLLTNKASIVMTDKCSVKVSNLKSRDYFFVVSACKPFMGKYYLKWICGSEIVIGKPKLDIFSNFRRHKDPVIEPNLIVETTISDLAKDIEKYYGKVVQIEGQYVYSENIPVIFGDIINYFFITDGKWKVGCSQRVGLPTHPETYKYQFDKGMKDRYTEDETRFNKSISGKYKVRAIGSVIPIEKLPKKRSKDMKPEEEELWTELTFFDKEKYKSLKGMFYTYFAQRLGRNEQ